MEDIQATEARISPHSSSNGSDNMGINNHDRTSTPDSASRARTASSDSFSSLELASLAVEVDARDEADIRDDYSRSMGSETASSTVSTSDSEGQLSVHWRGFFRVLRKGSSAMPFHSATLKSVPKLTRWKSRRIRDDVVPVIPPATLDTADLSIFKPTWKNFSLSDLQAATNFFSRENLIGEGGYAEVYKGQLPDGQFVAIKRLTRGSPEEMTMDYLSELGIIVHVDHPNIAKLIGYGVEGGMHLVLQLSPHGSLASLLYDEKEKLDWSIRYKVAMGTAEGIFYLHEGCQRRIIHKDIKAANILLTENFEAQISDFGLAKWLPDQWTHHTVSKIEGTFGYLPPEFFMHGIVDEKTDVYAYGVLLLELITGKQALDGSQHSVVMWARPLIADNKVKELVDPTLGNVYDLDELDRLVLTASVCTHPSAEHRPLMNQVVQILRGGEGSMEKLKELHSTSQRVSSEENFEAEEYNSTKYLDDLQRHMETVLGMSTDS